MPVIPHVVECSIVGRTLPHNRERHLSTMNSILQATADLLKSRKFKPAFTEDGNTLIVTCNGEKLFWTTFVDTSDDDRIITLLSRVPAKVPTAKRAACAKLLSGLNYGKRHGAFHLDFRDGEVLFCISNVLNAGIAPEETLDSLFGVTYSAMNNGAPQILKLIYGTGSAPDSKPAGPSPFRDRNVTPPGLNN